MLECDFVLVDFLPAVRELSALAALDGVFIWSGGLAAKQGHHYAKQYVCSAIS